MGCRRVITDQNLLETIEYENNVLPISFYEDHFDEYLNGELGHHWHDEFEFGLVLKGGLEYTLQETRILRAGDGVFVNSKALHRARQTEAGTIFFAFVFPPNLFALKPVEAVYQRGILPILHSAAPGLFLFKDRNRDQDLLCCLRAFRDLSFGNPDYELSVMELIFRTMRQVLFRISAIAEAPVNRMERLQVQRARMMLAYIHTHYGEGITVDRIAEAASIGRSECFRCFQGIIGKTPTEYLCEYRLSQAAHLLTSTERELSDICFSCGFNSASYFGKLFKEKCGLSPGQYRKNAKALQSH
ncbi:helix-turn-helix domain-containing protein [Gehongia tenuis]|uniref:Helix-turn-helix domain-containing protein n=1 Tax=Gehongia tenuis TaxID=2763655 RepID=A0A926HNS7_9FIRM|nr:AraC family transcriptional regulator [Gehongia tenuis]MBC8530929.1 helix-turn-helix domain-containing protein [Gehongia tenuis]